MPAQAPTIPEPLANRLAIIGQRVRERRKALRVSATAAAEAAGLSRVTLHRIERGEPSVTMGAYLNTLAALGLVFDVADAEPLRKDVGSGAALPSSIRLADYPQLARLAWPLRGATELTPAEALNLYERHWRHIDTQALDDAERTLLEQLTQTLAKGRLLV